MKAELKNGKVVSISGSVKEVKEYLKSERECTHIKWDLTDYSYCEEVSTRNQYTVCKDEGVPYHSYNGTGKPQFIILEFCEVQNKMYEDEVSNVKIKSLKTGNEYYTQTRFLKRF